MDSYNRGYDAGISGLSEAPDGSAKIGNATVSVSLSDISQEFANEAQAAGFYAISYTIEGNGVDGLSSGDTVLSFRGTDVLAYHPSTGLG